MPFWLKVVRHRLSGAYIADLEFVLDESFFVHGHASVVLLVVASLGRLQVEPRVRERPDVRQQRLNERMKFILKSTVNNMFPSRAL